MAAGEFKSPQVARTLVSIASATLAGWELQAAKDAMRLNVFILPSGLIRQPPSRVGEEARCAQGVPVRSRPGKTATKESEPLPGHAHRLRAAPASCAGAPRPGRRRRGEAQGARADAPASRPRPPMRVCSRAARAWGSAPRARPRLAPPRCTTRTGRRTGGRALVARPDGGGSPRSLPRR